MGNQTVVYDKAKYHHDTIIQNKMKIVQSEVHTAFYLGWIVEHDLISNFMREEANWFIEDKKQIEKNAIKIYEWFDCVFLDEMLNEEGNSFTMFYFDFEKGQYIHDYMKCFNVSGGADFFGVKYNKKNYEAINKIISERYEEWKKKDA